MKIKCEICNREFTKGHNGFSVHIEKVHKISSREYYINYLGKEEFCENCKRLLELDSIYVGFKKCLCSQMKECLICKGKFLQLSKHLREHNLTYKEYYDLYLKQPNEGKCLNCGRKTTFHATKAIYNKYCSFSCSNEHRWKRWPEEKRDEVKDNIRKTNSSEEYKEKVRKTLKEKYGEDVDNVFQLTKVVRDIQTKTISSNEKYFYDRILKLYPNTIFQYKEERYPSFCDFYIPELDLFIELNINWVHGKHWFSQSNEDLAIKEKWESFGDSYYRRALNCWTIDDVFNRNKARENNLNYVVLWNSKDIEDWFDLGCPIGKDWEKEYSWK